MKKTILILFGTRPELIKLFPLIIQIKNSPLRERLLIVNTGQHKELLDSQLQAFELEPDIKMNLGASTCNLTSMLAKTLEELQNLYFNYSAIEHVVVQGDTNTVLAASNFCFLNKLKLLHIEAGLRSGNLEHPFPEEFNRIVCSLSAYHHFAPTNTAKQNLILEGISPENISVTGNTVIDALELSGVQSTSNKKKRFLITLHRRENIKSTYNRLIKLLIDLSKLYENYEFLWIAHPNSSNSIAKELKHSNIQFKEPLPYFDFLNLLRDSAVIITDSGGVTEEATSLGIPTVIYRKCTERIETLSSLNPTIISTTDDEIRKFVAESLISKGSPTKVYGDGKASSRILKWIENEYHPLFVENLIIGGGIAGTGIVLNLMKHGKLDSFVEKGFALIEKSDRLVHGNLPSYHVNSDTLSNVFLECLEGKTENYICRSQLKNEIEELKKFHNKSIPLNNLGTYLESLGREIENHLKTYENVHLFKNTKASIIQKLDGLYSIEMDDGKIVRCKNLIIACGGVPIFKELEGLKGHQIHSDQLLKKEECFNFSADFDQNTLVIGGSHSAFSVADFLLQNYPDIFKSDASISIFANELPKIYYNTVEEARLNGYTEFTENDVCPKTKKLFRLAGLRMDGRALYIKISGINGVAVEKRIQIHIINENKELFHEKLKESKLIVHCTGYQFNLPQFIDENGQDVHFKGKEDLHWVDKHCRLLTKDGGPLENAFLTGLATGFIPSGELGGEQSFNGQTNGLWYYQNATAETILNSLKHASTTSLP